MKIQVTRQELSTALLFASTDESRYVLNGVCFSSRNNRPIMITTDGRRLCVIESNADQPEDYSPDDNEVVLAADFVKAVVSLSKAVGKKLFPIVCIEMSPGSKRVQVSIAENTFLDSHSGGVIEGAYPDWRQIIPPRKQNREPISEVGLNANYVADYAKATKLLGASTPHIQFLAVGPEQAIEVKLISHPQFYGLVMPTKLEEVDYQPSFLGLLEPEPA